MTTYSEVFGGANIYPSDISYRTVALTANQTLNWPTEASASTDYVTRIMDVTPTAGGFSLTLPAANGAGTGETILFNNLSAFAFTVNNAVGVQVAVVAPGTTWQVYLAENATPAGVWRVFQYGAALSAANASALVGTGVVAIGTLLSLETPITEFGSNYAAGVADRARLLVWTAAGGTLTLPPAATAGNGWFINLRNAGNGALVVDPSGSVNIDGNATKTYNPGESSLIATDGENYYTIGYGKNAIFAFDYTSINATGSGNYVLTGSELNRIAYSFTGVLTGDRTIIVPTTVQQYWVSNDTTGAYAFTVRTLLGTGVTISSGQSAIVYSNGVNVVPADTAGLSTPISLSNGGTGATTASGARINLGGSSTGIAVFTAADQPAAWSALGNAPTITGGTY